MCRALQSPADMLLGVDVVSCNTHIHKNTQSTLRVCVHACGCSLGRLSLPQLLFEGLNLILRSKLEFSLGLDGGWGCNG